MIFRLHTAFIKYINLSKTSKIFISCVILQVFPCDNSSPDMSQDGKHTRPWTRPFQFINHSTMGWKVRGLNAANALIIFSPSKRRDCLWGPPRHGQWAPDLSVGIERPGREADDRHLVVRLSARSAVRLILLVLWHCLTIPLTIFTHATQYFAITTTRHITLEPKTIFVQNHQHSLTNTNDLEHKHTHSDRN
jgi:hypothetical protein